MPTRLVEREYPLMYEPRGLTRKSLAATGMSEHHIGKALRSGELACIAHGLYLWRKDFDALGPVGRHRVHARHIASGLDTDEAISHISLRCYTASTCGTCRCAASTSRVLPAAVAV